MADKGWTRRSADLLGDDEIKAGDRVVIEGEGEGLVTMIPAGGAYGPRDLMAVTMNDGRELLVGTSKVTEVLSPKEKENKEEE